MKYDDLMPRNYYEIAATTTDEDEQIRLANSVDLVVRQNLAGNQHLFPIIQTQLMSDHITVRKELALNPNIIPDVQQYLANEGWYIKTYLMLNPYILPEILIKLLLEFKDSVLIDKNIYYNVKYHRPETQELLEKFLLLL